MILFLNLQFKYKGYYFASEYINDGITIFEKLYKILYYFWRKYFLIKVIIWFKNRLKHVGKFNEDIIFD